MMSRITSLLAVSTLTATAVRNWFNPKIQLVSIEGNIGAGKTTLLDELKKHYPSCTYVDEPVKKWQKLGYPSILELFYTDPKRWSFTFETLTLITRMASLQIPISPIKRLLGRRCAVIAERSIFTSLNVFAQVQEDRGMLSHTENAIYRYLSSILTGSFLNLDIKFVYVNTSPDVCYKRIQKRERSEEIPIQLSYLEELDKKHIKWMSSTPYVLHIDGNQNYEQNPTQKRKNVELIKKFIR